MAIIDTIKHELTDFIAERARVDYPLKPDTDLLEEGILDSLMMMDLVAHLESQHHVSLGDRDLSPQHFRTVSCLAALVAQKQDSLNH